MRPLMKLVMATAVMILVPAAMFAQPFDVEVVNGKEALSKEVLVKFRPDAASALPRIAAAADALEAHLIGAGNSGRIKSRSMNIVALVQLLRFDPDVELVEPNYIVRTTVDADDTYYGLLWGLSNTGQVMGGQAGSPGSDIQAEDAWKVTTGSRDNVVGIVDTGVGYNHPDLAGNIWTASAPFSIVIGGTTITCGLGTHGFNAITNKCDPLDDNDHGSHVSGTIGAVGNNGVGVTGINWTSSILGLKFLSRTGSGSTADAIDAIEFAVQVKQRGLANVRVLNNSWGGGGFSQNLLDEIKRANDNGILFVASAGNNGSNNDSIPSYPASYDVPNIISVAATDNRDQLASFSNYGATSVDLGAPGVYIASTSRTGYVYMSGTSMAAPHASGVAALVLAKCGGLDTAGLKSAILGSVESISSLLGKTVTGGRLNAYNALNSCSGTPPPAKDFAISASTGSLSTAAGGSASSTVSVTATNWDSSSITLSASGLPAGAAATFAPPSLTGTGNSTMTVTTSNSTPAGTYPLTVTGTVDSLVRSTTVILTVTAVQTGSFSIAISPPSDSVKRGESVSYTVTVTPTGGFTGTVGLSVSNLPLKSTGTFSLASVTISDTSSKQSVLTIQTTSKTKVGTKVFTVTGTSGSLVKTAPATITVN